MGSFGPAAAQGRGRAASAGALGREGQKRDKHPSRSQAGLPVTGYLQPENRATLAAGKGPWARPRAFSLGDNDSRRAAVTEAGHGPQPRLSPATLPPPVVTRGTSPHAWGSTGQGEGSGAAHGLASSRPPLPPPRAARGPAPRRLRLVLSPSPAAPRPPRPRGRRNEPFPRPRGAA